MVQIGYRGCIDEIFVIRQLVDKHLEKGKKMFAVCTDLEKAYDKVWRVDLWSALRQHGIGGRLLQSVELLYKESKACVRAYRGGADGRVQCEAGAKARVPAIPVAIFNNIRKS